MVSNRATTSWLYRYVVLPLGQMLIFIVTAAIIMTVFAYLLAFLFPTPRPNIILADQISRQLPGMIISGVTIGFVYAMIALGYTLVYGVLKFINFAHSEIFMFGGVVVVATSMLCSGLLAVVVERVAYRPLRGAPRLVPLISAIGISFFLADMVRAYEAVTRNAFKLTYPVTTIPALSTPITFAIGQANINLRITSLIVIVAAMLMLIALNYFVNGTKLGRGIRAVSQDMGTASLMGINVNLMISLTFFVGGAFGGAAGSLFGMNVGTIDPFVGFIPGIKAFTAAVLGGIGNVTGALLGGLMLGMLESFLNGTLVYFPALGIRYTDIFTFLVLILVLIFRPSGLLGERVDEKV